jgi:hypothetical protein
MLIVVMVLEMTGRGAKEEVKPESE